MREREQGTYGGGRSTDSGEWIEVRRRRRRESRQADGGQDRLCYTRGNHDQSFSQPRRFCIHDRHGSNSPDARDHSRIGRSQSRCNMEWDREFRRRGNWYYSRPNTAFRSRRCTSSAGLRFHKQGVRSCSPVRMQQQRLDARRISTMRNEGRVLSIDGSCDQRKEMKDQLDSGRAKEQRTLGAGGNLGSELKRYVSFYFTNFPAQLSIFYLRKGFEVCGMLEDVYVAKKRNWYGEPYGFVKFSNVRDVTKMTKALNAVWFGHFRVRASVAKFDRHDTGKDRRPEKDNVAPSKGAIESQLKDGTNAPTKSEVPKGGVVNTVTMLPKKKGGSVTISAKEDSGPADGVRVGDIVVKVGACQKRSVRKEVQMTDGGLKDAAQEKDCRVLLRKYHTELDDVKWARNGVVATVVNGEAIPVVQNRISDAGFGDLVLIPMGADKVFVRSSTGVDALSIVNDAKEFFKLVFSHWMRWGPEVKHYQRGAWVRVYGVPVHAWNVNFFKLCVFDCGRFLRADSCSADRDRLDFARVLIATPDLDIIKRVENVLVDGTLVEIKIVEEWGYAMREDTCLFEDECESEEAQTDFGEERVDQEARRNVDILIEKIADGLEEDVREDLQVQRDEIETDQAKGSSSTEGERVEDDVRSVDPTRPFRVCVESSTNQGTQGEPDGWALRSEVSSQTSEVRESLKTQKLIDEHGWGVNNRSLSKRSRSCPPAASCSDFSGPWSLEWIQDHDHGDAGVIFSASKRMKKRDNLGEKQLKVGQIDPRKRKEGGLLHHPVHSLKKVARLPSKDRSKVLKVLKRNVRRRRGGIVSVSRQASSDGSSSSASSNNDWQNWVAMQGNEQKAMDDVWELGNAIGVKVKGDNANMFSVLSRATKGRKELSGSQQGEHSLRRGVRLEGFLLSGGGRCSDEDYFLEYYRFGRAREEEGGSSPHAFSYRPSVGASGGLLTLWDPSEVDVWSTESREHVLWCRGRFIKSGEEFFVANVYSPCDDGAKQGLWDSLLVRFQSLGRERVCVCGDFNAVTHVDERRSIGGALRSTDYIPFNRFIDDNNLVDLPLRGRKFTWYRGDGQSMSRLDRFMLSEEWCLTWPNCEQVAKLRGLSDHCPLVLSANEEDWGPRPLRMLKCWKDVPGYNLFVREKWKSFQVDGWGGYAALKEWHKAHVQNLPSRIDSLKYRVSELDQKGEEEVLSGDEVAELHGATADIHSLSRLHASISWQQSRSLWLKDGDVNSKYFHSILAGRRRRNAISTIQVGGVALEGVSSIRQAVFSHFASHFKNSNVGRPGVDNLQFKRLDHSESSSLTKPFTENEVKSAVWDCDSYKSPGPDGINFGFIKDFWDDLRGDVMRFISDFHRNGKLTKGINSTFIALIPKIVSPQQLNDFRPISLVGSLYKILAKVLANRLRLVIGSVISEAQTSFVKDKQILDGILIANEVVDEARKSKKELLLFKVDFEKAYDSVDWGYLDEVMTCMSFPTLWRKWIKECVGTATASVLVNGSPTDEFPLERGLLQGDPLSPFLFLLVAEGLNVLMEAMVARNLFTGYSVGEFNPISVSHLQFADDTLILGVKSWANVRALRAVLVLFETMSGLKVNFNKNMLVGVNIPDSWLGEAASALCCKVGKLPFLYLGLPIGGDPRRLFFWEPVLTRLKKRLSGWKSRFLSFGGRLVLLKSVLTSLPVFALSFFKAPSDYSEAQLVLLSSYWTRSNFLLTGG
ncbi:hypothetical protein TSUD_398610 [Trifolium subterraneum]|uniref:Reverse transcriptase domain-containing protein n=1 Tax=Trifolium subterraneum TaxID=3900 RepID=A0A2Z6NFM9_TRISU|nr:hypothetical protein TSUD_398610 [Trifolium subterraneum]